MPVITKLTRSETLFNNEPEYFAKAVYEDLVELEYHNYPYIACADNGDVYAIEGYSDGSSDWRAERFVVSDSSIDRSNVFRMIIAAKDAMQESPGFRTRKELMEALQSGVVEWRDISSVRKRNAEYLKAVSSNAQRVEISVNAVNSVSNSSVRSDSRGADDSSLAPKKLISETPLGYLIALVAGAVAVQGFFFLSPLFLWLINQQTKPGKINLPPGTSLETARWVTWGFLGIVLSAMIRSAMKS